MAIEIEKGVPIPDEATGLREKYPFKKMEVGDSFLVPAGISKGSSLAITGYPNRVYAPKRFASQMTPEGRRVWRVA